MSCAGSRVCFGMQTHIALDIGWGEALKFARSSRGEGRQRKTKRTMRRIKVLELGWEFPPLINGGLGVACMGISRALAKKVDLSVIVPKASPGYKYDGFDLVGINNLKYRRVETLESGYMYESFAAVGNAPVDLQPYASEEGTPGQITFTREGKLLFSKVHKADLDLFTAHEDLYSGDLARKVIEFSKICAVMARAYDFDLVHAHDWMTYLAGVEVKKVTGKPLVVHLHASQFDRAGADARGWIYDIEKYGMEYVDQICKDAKPTDSNGTIAKEDQPVITSIVIRREE